MNENGRVLDLAAAVLYRLFSLGSARAHKTPSLGDAHQNPPS